ncbi:MAG: YbjQ family protein [Phascolarctobacterium sp.]|nr:YbjQ family protein [Phascolarctobacterium sp.]
MIITTTSYIEDRKITGYKGIVFGEVVTGMNFVKDWFAGVTDTIGGRSGMYEGELEDARSKALKEMVNRAEKLGADGIIGVSFDYEVLGEKNGMIMVCCQGTAVTLY